MSDLKWCATCGIPNTHEVNVQLWDIYDRLDDDHRFIEPLVFTQEDIEDDPDWYEDRESSGTWLAMERNMAERGLCVTCGRPDLRGVTHDMILSEEDARDKAKYYAEVAAERRMGC